jgi:thiamine-phosphate pyrophosphorylase
MKAKQAISGLYAVTPDVADTAALISKAESVFEGGARWMQYRNKTANQALRHEQALALKRLCGKYNALLIVNDDVDLAREIAADGVHVGGDDLTVAAARKKMGDAAIIGVSCYDDFSRARLAEEQGADYVAFGSFYSSAIKPDAVRASLSLLLQARRWGRLPVVAIGGITLSNAGVLLGAGADAIAVISALFTAPDIANVTREFCQLFETHSA